MVVEVDSALGATRANTIIYEAFDFTSADNDDAFLFIIDYTTHKKPN